MIESNEKLLLELIKVALGKSTGCALPNALDWNTLFCLSIKQCVPSVVMDGLNQSLISLSQNPSAIISEKEIKLKWLGMVLNMEKQYAKHECIVADLAYFYQREGYQMMLLKGYGLSKYWPISSHRPIGDIDIFLMDVDNTSVDKKRFFR